MMGLLLWVESTCFLRSLFNTGDITNIALCTASFFMTKFHNDLPPAGWSPQKGGDCNLQSSQKDWIIQV